MSAIKPALANEQYDFGFRNFSSVENLILNRDAAQAGDVLRLTPAERGMEGSAWFNQTMNVADGFISAFEFSVTERGGLLGGGGEGFSFNVHDLGFEQVVGESGTSGQLSVQFDTFQNEGEVSDNFVRVNYLGEPVRVIDLKRLPSRIDLSDGKIHSAEIILTRGALNLILDGVWVFYVPGIDVQKFSPAVVGFGARTGAAWENHDIYSWRFTTPGPHRA